MKKYYKSPLNEITRSEYLRASRIKSPERYAKLKNYYKQTNMLRELDFEKLFNDDEFVWKQMTGDYIVIIAFEGAFYELQKRVRSWGGVNRIKRITKRLLTECISKALDTEDLYVSCECPDFCLHGDTKIKLLDGNHYTIKEILEKFNNGDDIWVYSTDENGDFKPGHVTDVWISGKSSKMIKVTLDNDEEILTTPNHLYMLRNGDYMRADELQVGQSLMPMYFSSNNGYESVMLNSKPKSFVSVYKEVANSILCDEIQEAKIRSGEDKISIHHKNFIKSDNRPSNLRPMGFNEHYSYHYQHVMDDKERFRKFTEAGHAYWRTDEGRKIKSDQMRKSIVSFWENMTDRERTDYIERSHAWQRTDEGHEKLSKGLKRSWSSLSESDKQARTKQAALNMNGVNGEKASNRIKNYWANLSDEDYKKRCAQCKEAQTHATTTEKCIEARRKNGKKRQRNFVLDRAYEILKELLNNNLPITEENYNKYRKKGYPHFNVAVEYGALDNFNHKTKKIEVIEYEEEIPVYDITVDNYSNFLVSAGVVLHNCYRFDYWLSQEGGKYGPLQNRPPKVRNVNNNKGYVCKHILNALHGKRWVIAAASAWLDYIKANPELSSEYIWGD